LHGGCTQDMAQGRPSQFGRPCAAQLHSLRLRRLWRVVLVSVVAPKQLRTCSGTRDFVPRRMPPAPFRPAFFKLNVECALVWRYFFFPLDADAVLTQFGNWQLIATVDSAFVVDPPIATQEPSGFWFLALGTIALFVGGFTRSRPSSARQSRSI
jgi:hypothetical protein